VVGVKAASGKALTASLWSPPAADPPLRMEPNVAWYRLVEWLGALGMQTGPNELLVTCSSIAGDGKSGQAHSFIVIDSFK